MVEDGKISCDDNPLELLGSNLSEAHEYWQDLALAHCLQHKSGMDFGLEELLPMDDTNHTGFGEAGVEGSSQINHWSAGTTGIQDESIMLVHLR